MEIANPLSHVLRELPHWRQVGPSGKVEAVSEWRSCGAGRTPPPPRVLAPAPWRPRIECRASRNAALLQLGGELPAAVIADTLNVHRSTADRWVKLAGGDWGRYAAERARSAAT